MTDVMLVLDRDGRYLDIPPVNPALLYRPPADLLGHLIHDVFPSDEADRFVSTIRETLAAGEPRPVEYRLTLDDHVVWFAGTVSPLDAERVLWSVRDVTAQRQAEDELRAANERLEARVRARTAELTAALTALQALYEVTTHLGGSGDLADVLNLILDHSLRLADADYAAISLLDAGRRELRTVAARGPHAHLVAGRRALLGDGLTGWAAQRGEVVNVPDLDAEPRRRPDAPSLYAGLRSALIVPLSDPTQLLGVLVVMSRKVAYFTPMRERLLRGLAGQAAMGVRHAQQLAEREQLEAQFRQAQKMEAMGRLAGGVAHDFNNLLTVILGHTELLLAQPMLRPLSRHGLEEIGRAAERAAALTRQLLTFSRQEVLPKQVVDLNQVVAGIVELLRRLIGEDITLTTDLAPAPGQVAAAPGQIEQVVMNLAVNARDAMPRGGTLTLTTRLVDLDDAESHLHPGLAAGPYVRLVVRDTGSGMDEATLARIFEPFFTTKPVGHGTGLDLATVYAIVQQHGGAITVSSQLDHGTSFTIHWPRVEAPTTAPTAPVTPAAAVGSETILLVEDDPQLRALGHAILARAGYTVLEAGDARAAMAVADRHGGAIDLLLTDVVLPGESGRELADHLRQHRPGLRVLYVSGYTDDEVIRHGVLERAVAFLQKPFTVAQLTEKVREVLQAPPPTAVPSDAPRAAPPHPPQV